MSPTSLDRLGDEPQVRLGTSIEQSVDSIVYHVPHHLSSIVSADPEALCTVR